MSVEIIPVCQENIFLQVIELFVANFHTICRVGSDRLWHVSIGGL